MAPRGEEREVEETESEGEKGGPGPPWAVLFFCLSFVPFSFTVRDLPGARGCFPLSSFGVLGALL